MTTATMTRHNDIVGISPMWQQIYAEVRLAGPTDAKVLITGESGVGKEVDRKSVV